MNRSFLILLGAAGLLVVLVLVFANPFEDSIRSDVGDREVLVDPAAVRGADRVEVRASGKEPVVLVREGDLWRVETRGGFPADTTAVSAVLNAVAGARSGQVVSTNPEKRTKFQVDASGVEILISSGGNEVSHLWVGKGGTDFSASYVRLDGEDAVHVVRGINRNMMDRYRGYRDHTLLKFDVADVSSVSAMLPKESWEMARGDTAWIVTPSAGEAVAADPTQVDGLLRALSNVAADGFADTVAVADAGLGEPDYRFAVRFLNGSEATIALGDTTETSQYYAGRPDRDAVFLLGKWRLANLDKTAADLAGGSQ